MADGDIIINTKLRMQESIKEWKNTMQELKINIDTASKYMDQMNKKALRLEQQGKADTDAYRNFRAEAEMAGQSIEQDTIQMEELAQKIEKAEKRIEAINDKMLGVTTQTVTWNQSIDEIVQDIQQFESETQTSTENLDEAEKETGEVAEKAKTASINFNKVGVSVKNSVKGIKDMSKGMGKAVKSLLKYSLTLIGVRGVISLIRSSINEWMNSGNENARQLKANLSQLKTSIASMLAPAIEAVLTIFYRILSVVNTIVKAMTGFSMLSKSTAKSSGATAKNMSNALASFDELNVLQQDEGGGGGGEAEPAGNLEAMMPNLEEFENLIKERDWYGLGKYIADKLNEGIETLNSTWPDIIAGAQNFGTGLAEFLNGQIENINWAGIGDNIAGGLNTALNFVYTFLTTFNFAEFGKGLADMLSRAITGIDWKLLAQTINAGIHGAFAGLSSFIRNMDWAGIGQSVGTALANIDWLKIAYETIMLIFDVFAGLLEFAGGILAGIIQSLVDYMAPYVEQCGGDVIAGFLLGIKMALINLGDWLRENVVQPFLDWIHRLFDMHSPSKVMADIGSLIIEGLKQGIVNTWNAVLAWFQEHIAPKLTRQYWIDKLSNMKSGLAEAFKASFNGIIDIVERAINFIVDKLNTIHVDAPGWVQDLFGVTGWGINLNHVYIPRLAKGGIVNQPTQAIIGERGREAVLPLENNTEWMEQLAETIGSQDITINFAGNMAQLVRLLNPEIIKENKRTGRKLIGGMA